MDASTGRKRRAVRRVVVVAVVAMIGLGAMQIPASASGEFHKDLRVLPRSYKSAVVYKLDGRFTEMYRSKGWIQTYGTVKVTNKSKRTIAVTCGITLKTGGVAVGVGAVALKVAKYRTVTAPFGIEAGDERGIVTGDYLCQVQTI